MDEMNLVNHWNHHWNHLNCSQIIGYRSTEPIIDQPSPSFLVEQQWVMIQVIWVSNHSLNSLGYGHKLAQAACSEPGVLSAQGL